MTTNFWTSLISGTWDINEFLTWLYEARGDSAVTWAETERENLERRDAHAISMIQFLWQIQKDVPVGLNQMRMVQLRQMLHAGTVKGLYCQKDDGVCNMFCWIFRDIKVFNAYRNGAATSRISWRSDPEIPMAQGILQQSTLKIQLHFHAIMFFEDFLQTRLVSAACQLICYWDMQFSWWWQIWMRARG